MIMMWRRGGELIAQSAVAAYALPAHSILQQRAVHGVNIHVSFFRMTHRSRINVAVALWATRCAE